MKKSLFTSAILLSTAAFSAQALDTVDMKPLSEHINVSNYKSSVKGSKQLPQITWAEDMRTVLANGNSSKTQNNSLFDQYNLDYKLVLKDSVISQSKDYISGKTPFFRGTLDQVVQLNELVYDDPSLRPVVINLLSWSKGGDVLVGDSNVKTLSDLRGKKIAVTAYGPHTFFLWRALKSGGLNYNDVDVVWMKDLLGSANTPANAFCHSSMSVNATFVIAPEGTAITEGDNACKNSKVVYGTAQASKVIPDVYAIRSDYYESNKDEIQRFVHAMLIAKEKADLVAKNTKSNEYKNWLKASAQQLLGSQDLIEDVDGMFKYDADHAGFSENIEFFTDKRAGRNFERVSTEINDALIDMKLISKRLPLQKADWNWNELKIGLKHADDVKVPAFNKAQTKKIVIEMQTNDTLDSEQFMTEEVKFSAGSSTFMFNPDYHGKVFDKLIDEASTYDSTLIIIQAHSDPSYYLINKYKNKATESTLKRIRQKAWNLSEQRAKEVRRAIVEYARDVRGIDIDESQFETVGYGIEKPKTGLCRGEPCKIKLKGAAAREAYAGNRRAIIGFTRIEAEMELSDDDFDF